MAAIDVNQSASINKLLSRWKQFYARYKMASLKKNLKKNMATRQLFITYV